MRTSMSQQKIRSPRALAAGPWLLAAVLAGGCAAESGAPPLEFELPGESAEPLAAANCEGAELCTAPTLTRGSCYVVLSDTDVKREVAQTFSVSRAAQPGSVRLTLKKLVPEAAGTTPRLKIEVRELDAGKIPLDANRTVATATIAAADLPTGDLEREISFDSTVTLQASIPGAPPRYALVMSVENGNLAVGVGCTDTSADPYPTGTALQRQMRRLSPTSFSSPPFSADTRDVSFAFLLACGNGLADCDLNGTNWCEINITNDEENCGGCGLGCSTANVVPSCVNGSCDSGACVAGYGNCDGDMRGDGCETNTQTTTAHCGACNAGCSTSNIAAACTGGNCTGTCLSPYADCNNDKRIDGCEVNLSNNPNNCGGCGTICSSNNMASRTCAGGVCNGNCVAGYTDCNGNKQVDGCEIHTAADPNNCGGCGTVCSAANMATRTCGSGTCNGSCAAGFADCNGNKRVDGCETNIASSADTCGGCGIVCSSNHMATRTCSGGSCSGACAAGWGDCNGNKQTDGCETPTNTVANCGACGNVCGLVANAQTNACVANACTVTACSAGFYDLDGNYANGCECKNDDPAPDQCVSPRDLGTLTTTASYTGKVPTVSGDDASDYVTINIPLNGSGSWGQKFGTAAGSTLNIAFSGATDAGFRFEVIAGPCGGSLRPCSAAGGSATGLRTYSLTDNVNQTCTYFTQSQVTSGNLNGVGSAAYSASPAVNVTCGCSVNNGTGTNGAFNSYHGSNACRDRRDAANAVIAWNPTYVIRVYRVSAPTSCSAATYTLNFSRS